MKMEYIYFIVIPLLVLIGTIINIIIDSKKRLKKIEKEGLKEK